MIFKNHVYCKLIMHWLNWIMQYISALQCIITLTLCTLGFLSSADFFQNRPFRKILSGIPAECQTVWIQIRPDITSGLIWVQTVCKGYQQTTLVGNELMGIIWAPPRENLSSWVCEQQRHRPACASAV